MSTNFQNKIVDHRIYFLEIYIFIHVNIIESTKKCLYFSILINVLLWKIIKSCRLKFDKMSICSLRDMVHVYLKLFSQSPSEGVFNHLMSL